MELRIYRVRIWGLDCRDQRPQLKPHCKVENQCVIQRVYMRSSHQVTGGTRLPKETWFLGRSAFEAENPTSYYLMEANRERQKKCAASERTWTDRNYGSSVLLAYITQLMRKHSITEQRCSWILRSHMVLALSIKYTVLWTKQECTRVFLQTESHVINVIITLEHWAYLRSCRRQII